MEVNGTIVKLAILLLPGIVGSKVYRKLRGRTEKQAWEDFVEILLFALLSYAVIGALLEGAHRLAPVLHRGTPTTQPAGVAVSSIQPTTQPTTQPAPFEALFNEKAPIPWWQVCGASLMGAGLAFLASLVHRKRWLNKFAYWCRVTKRDGDADVWSLFHDHYGPPSENQWTYVRDHKTGLVYFGEVRRFSASGQPRELLLENVEVWRNDLGTEGPLYSVQALYLQRGADEITIEYPKPAATHASQAEKKGAEANESVKRPAEQDHRDAAQAG